MMLLKLARQKDEFTVIEAPLAVGAGMSNDLDFATSIQYRPASLVATTILSRSRRLAKG